MQGHFHADPPTTFTVPTPTEVRVVQEQDRALQQWIKHHSTSSSRFKPALIECAEKTQVWADTGVTPTHILVPPALQRFVFDSLHSQGSRPAWHSSNVYIGGKALGRMSLNGLNNAKHVKKRRSRCIRKCRLNDNQHRPGDSVKFTAISSAH